MKKNLKFILLALLAGSLSFAEARKQTVVEANNHVGLRLMQETTKEEIRKSETKNILISPLSAHEALSMALNGTAGKTEAELMKFFGYAPTAKIAEINSAASEIRSSLIKTPMTAEEKKKLRPGERPAYGLTVANSAWHTNGKTDGRHYAFSSNYISTLKSSYGVKEVKALDFLDKNSDDVVNKWCSDNTNGMIKKIVDEEILAKLLWILLNATYLEGAWETPFTEIKGQTAPNFTLASNQKVLVSVMNQRSTLGYFEDGHVQAVELPLHKSSVSVYVIAPRTVGEYLQLQKDGGVWTKEFLEKIIAGSVQKNGILQMPKFSFDYGVELREDMPLTRNLGLNFLFKNTAQFTKMDAPDALPSKVGIIKQNTRVEWDENGIKAAAVTMVGGVERTSVPPPPQFTLLIDKPFFFVIHDKSTKSHLFLGQVADPRGK